jgi:hypothetical protein
MKRTWTGALLVAAPWLGTGFADAQSMGAPPGEAAPEPADYRLHSSWLCRPGRADACAQDQTTTVIAADGQMTREAFTARADPAIDCFYIYPTASFDPGGNSDLEPGAEEKFVALVQFARFAAACRPFAPMYRQATLTSLRARMNGVEGPEPDRALGYGDVLAAWHHYLAHENQGRGIVLIGHSQGAAVLIQLIRDEIDGRLVQAQLVSAILLGANVMVPEGADVGGTFQHIPACRAATQTGCVIAYVTFRDTAPPPAVGIFAHANDPQTGHPIAGHQALCTNPASLEGDSGFLNGYFPTVAPQWTPPEYPWVSTHDKIDTPFVSTPGLVSAQCISDGPSTYLAVRLHARPEDLRTHDIPGDVIVNGRLFPDWGLHRIDVQVAIGNLIDIVGRQAVAYLSSPR